MPKMCLVWNFADFKLGAVHILRQHLRGGGGVHKMMTFSDKGGGGVSPSANVSKKKKFGIVFLNFLGKKNLFLNG